MKMIMEIGEEWFWITGNNSTDIVIRFNWPNVQIMSWVLSVMDFKIN